MSSGAFLTEERMREIESSRVRRYSDLKKKRDNLTAQFREWEALFKEAAKACSAPGGQGGFDFLKLPGPAEVAQAWKEIGEVRDELAVIQEEFRSFGLEIE